MATAHPADPVIDRPETALGFLLNQAAVIVRDRTAAALAPLNLHPRVFGVLLLIGHQPGITQTEASQRLRIDRTTMSQLVTDLSDRKLIKQAVSPDDRRNRRLQLTAQGSRTLRRAAALAEQVEHDVTAGLSRADNAALKSTLAQLLRSL